MHQAGGYRKTPYPKTKQCDSTRVGVERRSCDHDLSRRQARSQPTSLGESKDKSPIHRKATMVWKRSPSAWRFLRFFFPDNTFLGIFRLKFYSKTSFWITFKHEPYFKQ